METQFTGISKMVIFSKLVRTVGEVEIDCFPMFKPINGNETKRLLTKNKGLYPSKLRY
jgi:hypothetical protein